jgi:hypothetical protein
LFESGRPGLTRLLMIIRQLELCRRDIADRREQPPVVEPVHPFERRVFDRILIPLGATLANDLGLEEPDDRLGQRIVVRVAGAANRGLDTGLGQSLGVATTP